MYPEIAIILIIILLLVGIYLKIFTRKDIDIFKNNIYLDNNGTTPISDGALIEYNKNSKLGNASATYATDAKKIIESTDNLVKSWISSSDANIIYTSGASESNNNVQQSIAATSEKPHFILSSYEHKSNLNCAKMLAGENKIQLTLIDPDIYGIIQPNSVISAIQPNTVLVSIMSINNELGTVNDIKTIGQEIKKKNPNIFFHVDAVQSFGKYQIPMNEYQIDALSVSMHKLNGPQGIGLLILSNRLFDKIKKHPLICGEQYDGARGGTYNIAAIASSYKSIKEAIMDRTNKNIELFKKKQYIINYLKNKYNVEKYEIFANKPDSMEIYNKNNNEKYAIVFLGDEKHVSPNTILLSVIKYGPIQNHFCNIKLKKDLLDKNVIISIGSVCHQSSTEPSHVLYSIKAPFIIRCGVIRISLGDYNTMNDAEQFCKNFSECLTMQ